MWTVERLFCGAWRPLANEDVLGDVVLFATRAEAEEESSAVGNEWDVRVNYVPRATQIQGVQS